MSDNKTSDILEAEISFLKCLKKYRTAAINLYKEKEKYEEIIRRTKPHDHREEEKMGKGVHSKMEALLAILPYHKSVVDSAMNDIGHDKNQRIKGIDNALVGQNIRDYEDGKGIKKMR